MSYFTADPTQDETDTLTQERQQFLTDACSRRLGSACRVAPADLIHSETGATAKVRHYHAGLALGIATFTNGRRNVIFRRLGSDRVVMWEIATVVRDNACWADRGPVYRGGAHWRYTDQREQFQNDYQGKV